MRGRLQALFCGVAFGVAVGLLCAPKSGARTRRMISLKAKEGKLFLQDQTEDLRENVHDAVERGRSALLRTVQASRRAFAG